MKFLDLSTDVLAVKCIKNYVFIGTGCMLYVISKIDFKTKIKISALYPDNIHDIVISNSNLIVYGRKSLRIFKLDISDDCVSVKLLHKLNQFNDWIIHVNWLEPLSDSTLTILFAHNNVYNYNLSSDNFTNTICKETCLLYAGTITGQNYKNAIIFSGTVFQEILIWQAKNDTNITYSEVLHRLKGHKGVIFSIFYNPLNNLIGSTSDDRTVRLWKVSNTYATNEKAINWENVEISLQTTMYGHLARVWKAVLYNNIIASIGEDSRICFWNLSGALLHKIEAHKGVPIWCIDISQDDIVYTGGADGYVNSWSLTNIKSYMENYILLNNSNNQEKGIIPKNVKFMDNSDVLIFSNSGSNNTLLHFSEKPYQLVNSFDIPDYSSTYCIIELSLDRQCIALASIKGEVSLYKKIKNEWKYSGPYKIMDSKIFSIQWLDQDIVLLCGSEGVLYVVKFLSNDIKILCKHVLPPSRERWITSGCIYNNLLICGDRMGSIFIYKLKIDSENPLQTFKRIHGRLGVQSCTIMNSNLITTGRDGTIRFYKFCNINSENPLIEYLYAKNMPMDWVSKLLQIESDYYVLGFKEEDFIIYNVQLKRILVKISCGGGHRSWDCLIQNELIHFVYIQKRKVCAVTVPLNKLYIPPLLTGFHEKEIYCIKTLPLIANQHNILLSGGEDCSLHINYINSLTSEIKPNIKLLHYFDGHLSSIKCISIHTLIHSKNMSKHLIFSGGGRAQLKIWEISVNITSGSTFSSENISCKDVLSYMLHGPDKVRNKIWVGNKLMYNADSETRYMDISTLRNPENTCHIFIFVACSDGYLRTFIYNIKSNEIKLIDTLAYKNRCILKVYVLEHQNKIILLTMATDGFLNFWNVSILNETILIKNILIDGQENLSLHQSGINSYDVKVLNDSQYILATGGDDNLLNLLIFQVLINNKNVSIQTTASWKNNSAHYAQITGLKLLDDNRLFSVGADQKLLIHKYLFNDSKISARLLEEKIVCISDIQGITLCENITTDAELFCIYGKGLQFLQSDRVNTL